MGWIKDAKVTTMAAEAQKAWDADRPMFTPMLNMPSTHSGMSSRIEDWEVMLAAIVEVGWVLHTWAVCSDNKGRPQAQPLFVRP